ncbi:hypothetical protein AVEN_116436-1, partial [Araneus ventricosus]
HITHKLVKRAIFIQWFIVMAIVLLPLVGFGLYYKVDEESGAYICARYRQATEPPDIAYAYVMFVVKPLRLQFNAPGFDSWLTNFFTSLD